MIVGMPWIDPRRPTPDACKICCSLYKPALGLHTLDCGYTFAHTIGCSLCFVYDRACWVELAAEHMADAAACVSHQGLGVPVLHERCEPCTQIFFEDAPDCRASKAVQGLCTCNMALHEQFVNREYVLFAGHSAQHAQHTAKQGANKDQQQKCFSPSTTKYTCCPVSADITSTASCLPTACPA